MNRSPTLRSIPAALLLHPLLTAPLAAQHVLLADDSGKMIVVRAAKGSFPCVERDGKVVSIDARHFVLKEVSEYLPAFVSVRDINVRSSYNTINGTGQMNNEFHFNAEFETRYRLNDVFLVLYLETESARKTLFLSEVGQLEPNVAKPISVYVPMDYPLGSGHYYLHLFSGGAEVLQTEIPFDEREAALDRMVAKRIVNVHAAAPKLFIGPSPEYPSGLKKANLKGQAVISIRIGANGAVYDPVVKSATDPAFGEAALAAVRLWRFLPQVKDDHPVETKADVPIVFAPPNPAKDRS